MWLREREWHAEFLDDASLATVEVETALRGLHRLNRISRSVATLWAEITGLAHAKHLQQVSVLDLACGGGDNVIALMRRARQANLGLAAAACDLNPSSLAYARQQAARAGFGIDFFACDVLNAPLPEGYDIVMCSLFLHHLQQPQALILLQRMAGAAQHLVLVNDLQRHMVNYALVWLGSRLLSRSAIVHQDAIFSMKNAFSRHELAALARQAGMRDCCIALSPPARMMLRWEKS